MTGQHQRGRIHRHGRRRCRCSDIGRLGAEQARLARAPARVLGRQHRAVLALFRSEFAIQFLARGAGASARSARLEELGGALLHADRDGEQIVRVADAARHAREHRRAVDRARVVHRRHVDVVAQRERIHVLALHCREAAEQFAQRFIGRARRRAVIERLAAELDLERLAHGAHRRRVIDRAGLETLERCPAQRAAAVWKRKAFAQLRARRATPAQRRACAADIRFAVVIERRVTFRAEHRFDFHEVGASSSARGGTNASTSAALGGHAVRPCCR